MYEPVDPKASFPALEEAVLAFWKEHGIFEKSVSDREGSPEYVFYDGPPFATGLPHFGHFVPGTIKDIIPRYKTMKGFQVERRFGWDCHGLPVEYEMEKELGISGKKQIEDYGVANFNEACRSIVLRYTNEWRSIMTRAGRWVDFDHDYKTMDPDYMESIWWVVKKLWDEGLIYEGHYILPYCPRCSTVLSNHELQLGGYKDVHDPAVTVKFRVTVDPQGLPGLSAGSTFFLAWTTTPWTLPSNLALAVGSDVDYVIVEDGTERYVLAEARLEAYYKDVSSIRIVTRCKGSALTGAVYEPLFPYFAEHEAKGAFRVHVADYVTTEDGTGIVHTAPGFGEDDYQTLKGTGVPTECPVDGECKFTPEVTDYAGRFVKDCDKDIIERLKTEGKLVKREQYLHAYPHCWRCQSPLIYRAVSSWFVKIDPIKQKMLNANSSVYWMPGHIRDGRFGKWLENARDWAISRNRYWGNPLPIWKCDSCGSTVCVGSVDELEQVSGSRPADLHKHFVDDITWSCDKPGCGGTMRRIPEVLDCWFESGSMPYAQVHYPFENKTHFEEHFPADFICEGLDQTRGWFYTLTILAAALFDKPAFKACVVNGLVLAADGKKMSKSLRNYTDPVKVMDEFGADALRLLLMHSALTRADDLCYSDEGVRDVVKSILLPLWSAYGFFVTYANIDGIQPGEAPIGAANPMDRWILSTCETMVRDVTAGFEAYDMQKAIDPMVDFIDSLNNWYIRRSRRRFWRSENDGDKVEAYSTLYRVLKRLALCMAPVAPFITETMWKNLKSGVPSQDAPESIHLALYPEYDERYRDEDLEWKMAAVRKAVSMGRSLRYQHNLKIRQPLRAVHLVTRDDRERAVLLEMEDIIRDELNVKDVVFRDDEEDLVEYQAKANFRVLGKELGKLMKAGAAIVEKLEPRQIAALLGGSTLVIDVAGQQVELTSEKVEVRRLEKASLRVINEGTLTVALDAEIDQSLLDEGNARDLIRGVQTLRKDSGLAVTDRIVLTVSGTEGLKRAFEAFGDFVAGETLAVALLWEETADVVEVEAGDEHWKVSLRKA
ncbi:MAG: isoleucine--tRNA ligase [Spirochaetales bacterium]|nr:isoleucine--tRNA ligase [Spirochaetales bacterium]